MAQFRTAAQSAKCPLLRQQCGVYENRGPQNRPPPPPPGQVVGFPYDKGPRVASVSASTWTSGDACGTAAAPEQRPSGYLFREGRGLFCWACLAPPTAQEGETSGIGSPGWEAEGLGFSFGSELKKEVGCKVARCYCYQYCCFYC